MSEWIPPIVSSFSLDFSILEYVFPNARLVYKHRAFETMVAIMDILCAVYYIYSYDNI